MLTRSTIVRHALDRGFFLSRNHVGVIELAIENAISADVEEEICLEIIENLRKEMPNRLAGK